MIPLCGTNHLACPESAVADEGPALIFERRGAACCAPYGARRLDAAVLFSLPAYPACPEPADGRKPEGSAAKDLSRSRSAFFPFKFPTSNRITLCPAMLLLSTSSGERGPTKRVRLAVCHCRVSGQPFIRLLLSLRQSDTGHARRCMAHLWAYVKVERVIHLALLQDAPPSGRSVSAVPTFETNRREEREGGAGAGPAGSSRFTNRRLLSH